MLTYRCTGCRRVLARRECVYVDDPMAPLGPELVCRDCQSLVTPQTSPVVIAIGGIIAALAGLGVGWLIGRVAG